MATNAAVADDFNLATANAGTAAAAALQRTKVLIDALSPGKAFDAITAMSEVSATAAIEYQKAAIAVLREEIALAERNIARANALADELHRTLDAREPVQFPGYLKQRNSA
jgi:hypothetical protein